MYDPDTGELVQQGSTLEYKMYNNNEELHLQCASDQHTSLNRDIFPVWYKDGKVVGMFVLSVINDKTKYVIKGLKG